jgi:hypothetical protein
MVGLFTLITGFGLTVTVLVAVPEHPEVVPVTVYVVVDGGVAVTLAPVPLDKVAVGVQV